MKKIANIVHNSKKNDYSPLFNVVKSLDDVIEGLPTLVIGWKLMKEINPNANILDKQCDGIYWTFSKMERRCDYEEDVIQFYNTALNKIMSDVKYTYIDIPRYSLKNIKKMINYLKNEEHKVVFLTKGSNFMFVYSEHYNTVFGISLTMCEYLGVMKKKIIKLVNNAEFIRDTNFMNSDIRRVIGTNTHYLLPLYSYFR